MRPVSHTPPEIRPARYSRGVFASGEGGYAACSHGNHHGPAETA